jgi:hypothetical protein
MWEVAAFNALRAVEEFNGVCCISQQLFEPFGR